jgi:DNA invertase Pin-like site-specific DNA recombinase
MNYQKHYDALIERAKNRLLEGYCETHHIIPRCMGGTDRLDNLIDLTAEEHYIAHQLLSKIYPKNDKLRVAAKTMRVRSSKWHRETTFNKLYGFVRRTLIAQIKAQWASGTRPKKVKTNRKIGRPTTIKQKVKSNGKIGRPTSVTEITKHKICEMYLNGMSYKRIAATLSCGCGTVYKVLVENNLFVKLSIEEGIERARKNGIRIGRPTNVTQEVIEFVKKDKTNGLSIKKIAKKYKIGVGTTYRILEKKYG